ncbi:MAG: DUF58 domain-containing protein [Verrucomicrobiales bacterium]|nr:DUF58 domain-containing protein [Verrucomicrobiales bacterium]
MPRPRLTPVLYSLYRRGERISQGLRRRVTEAGWFMIMTCFVIGLSGVDTQWSLHHQIFAILFMVILLAILGLFFIRRPQITVQRRCPRYATAGEDLRFPVLVTNLAQRGYQGLRFREWMTEILPSREEFVNRPEPREKERNLFDRTFVYYRWLWLLETKRLASGMTSEEFDIAPEATIRVTVRLRPNRRGLLTLRNLRVLRKDPFGLFQRALSISEDQGSLLILPRRYPIPDLEMPGRQPVDDVGAGLVASSLGQSDDFVGLRDYRPGDPVRHIHWRSWARLNRPVVKEFEEEHVPRFALALDSTLLPDQDTEVFEEAVSVAASFVSGIKSNRVALDCLFAGDQAYRYAQSGSGANRTPEKMLEILATIEPTHDIGSLDAMREAMQGHAISLSAAILIFTEWCGKRADFVKALGTRGVHTIVLVVTEDRRESLSGLTFLPVGEIEGLLATLPLSLHPSTAPATA